jgi:hypothetical protein
MAHKHRSLNKKVPMWTLVARRDSFAHAAVAAAVLPQDVQVRWFDPDGPLPVLSPMAPVRNTVVLLEPPAHWRDAVEALTHDSRAVWVFRGALGPLQGVGELGDDVLHGLQYAVHAALVHPLNSALKGVVTRWLARSADLMDAAALHWLEECVTAPEARAQQLADLWRMNNEQWATLTRRSDLHCLHDRLKVCWGVQARAIASPAWGTIHAIITPTLVQEHQWCMHLRAMRDGVHVDFALVILPRTTDDGVSAVHWRALDAPPALVAEWRAVHGDAPVTVRGDPVAWLNDLGPSRLQRLLAVFA